MGAAVIGLWARVGKSHHARSIHWLSIERRIGSRDGGADVSGRKPSSPGDGRAEINVIGADLRLAAGPLNALTDVPGIKVGHFTHAQVARGVTAVLCEEGAAAGVS